MKRLPILLVLAAVAATPVRAQHRHPAPSARPAAPPMPGMMTTGRDSTRASHHMPMMMMDMAGMDSLMPAMHAMMAFAPAALLERRAELRLDDDQARRLSALANVSRPAHDSAMTAAQQHRRALRDALAGGDPAAAGHVAAMHAAMGSAHAVQLRASLEARAVLTAGQRSLVEAAGHQHGGSR